MDNKPHHSKNPGNNGNIDVGCRLCVARPQQA